MMTPSDRETLRRETLRLLAVYPDTRFKLPVIVDYLLDRMPQISFDEIAVAESLAFFEGLFLVRRIPSQLQGPPLWQITEQGKLFNERNP